MTSCYLLLIIATCLLASLCANVDYYSILEVNRNATPREIKKAFRRLARKYHPNRGSQNELSDHERIAKRKKKWMELNRAYQVLSDKEKRTIYDLYGEAAIKQYENNQAAKSIRHGGGIFDAFFNAGSVRSRVNPTVGLSVGGAKDINLFREAILAETIPLLSSITVEGVFYDYYFDTGTEYANKTNPCQHLFCPKYSSAVIQNEYYLSVGLSSGIQDFKRSKLNLVIVLDISGSMQTTLHHDGNSESYLSVAKKSIVALLKHLNNDDRIGIVTFDHESYIVKSLDFVANSNLNELSNQILSIKPGGVTNFVAGYKTATDLFNILSNEMMSDSEYDNRIIFLTDAIPNVGKIDGDSLLGLTKRNVQNEFIKIYSTFIGIGVNFNSDLIDFITKIEGANYYSVHSYNDFMKRMDCEFDYMVTPLIFDVNLSLKSTRNMYTIDKIYGSPTANQSTGNIMKINTLFPSSTNEKDEVKGGIILIKLIFNNSNNIYNSDIAKLKLNVNYKDRNGKKYENSVNVIFVPNANTFDNTGIRKAILLSQYVTLMHEWIKYEKKHDSNNSNMKPLNVNDEFKATFAAFAAHFKREMLEIGDDTLRKELDILNKLTGEHQDADMKPKNVRQNKIEL